MFLLNELAAEDSGYGQSNGKPRSAEQNRKRAMSPDSDKGLLPMGNEPAVLDSSALFWGRRELVIRHAGQDYHLKITRQDKLILTK